MRGEAVRVRQRAQSAESGCGRRRVSCVAGGWLAGGAHPPGFSFSFLSFSFNAFINLRMNLRARSRARAHLSLKIWPLPLLASRSSLLMTTSLPLSRSWPRCPPALLDFDVNHVSTSLSISFLFFLCNMKHADTKDCRIRL